LRLSANVYYQQAAQDIEYLTGIRVSAKTQQRLVHRQSFDLPSVNQPVQELGVDGGKVRLTTALNLECQWREYKVIATGSDCHTRYKTRDFGLVSPQGESG
jgi:hypothetical protein